MTTITTEPDGQMLTRAEVADLYRVSTDTVARWEKRGYLTPIKLPGGLVRYRAEQVHSLRGSVA